MYLSIIVPIYNVEQYIVSCFESLFRQSLDTALYEVIAVNDGTPDNSMILVEQYAEKYSNIRIVNKENGGVSSARNEGIKQAVGDFILFVDPDDTIAENSLIKVYDFLSLAPAVDILIMRSFVMGSMTERYSWSGICPARVNMSGVDVFQKGYSRGSVCGCVFSRKFMIEKQLFFYEELINGEDTYFFHLSLLHAMRVCFMELPFYYVFVRVESASKNFSIERIFKFSGNIRLIDEYLTHAELTDRQKAILNYVKYSVVSNAVNHYIGLRRYDYWSLKKKIWPIGTLPLSLKYAFIQRSKMRLLRFSFPLFFSLCVLKNICRK